MPQYRAKRAFGIEGKGIGHVRTGTVVTMSQGDADRYNRAHPKSNPILEPFDGPRMPEPDNNSMLPGAPNHGDDLEKSEVDDTEETDLGNEDAPPPVDWVAPRAVGRDKRSSASRLARALRKRT